MRSWLLRGCVMGVVHAVAQTILAAVAAYHPATGDVLRFVVLAVLVGVAGLWGAIDAWLRRPVGVLTWFGAALVGGLLSGLLGVLGQAWFVDQTGVSALGVALTAGAGFTALLILLPAAIGIAVGGRLEPPTPRGRADKPSPHPRAQSQP